jgi:acyl carrier protein
MNTEINSQLRDFLAKNILFTEDGGALADDASFLAGGVIDSLGVMELVEYVRRQFGFEVPTSDIVPANFDSIARLSTYIRRRLAEQASASARMCLGAGPIFESMALRTEVAGAANDLSAGAA